MAQEVGGSIPLGHPNHWALFIGGLEAFDLSRSFACGINFQSEQHASVNEMPIERIPKCLWVEVRGTLSSSSASSSIGRASDS